MWAGELFGVALADEAEEEDLAERTTIDVVSGQEFASEYAVSGVIQFARIDLILPGQTGDEAFRASDLRGRKEFDRVADGKELRDDWRWTMQSKRAEGLAGAGAIGEFT